MSLLSTIKQQQVQARLARESATASTLTTLLGEASAVGKNDGNRETSDDEVVAVIKKFIKNIDETISSMVERNLDHSSFTAERALLESFLPKQLTADELEVIVAEFISDEGLSGARNMGVVMKHLQTEYAGKYDGKVASTVVRGVLG